MKPAFSLLALIVLVAIAPAPAAAQDGPGPVLQTSAICCPKCHHAVCCPEAVTEKEKKHCWDVECKEICIPAITFPWQKCDGSPRCGKVITVRVLKKHEYECEKCGTKWNIESCPAGTAPKDCACSGGLQAASPRRMPGHYRAPANAAGRSAAQSEFPLMFQR